MSASSRPWSGLLALVLDNAVARKDALVLARQRGAFVALAVAFVVVTVTVAAVALAIGNAAEASLYRSHIPAYGRHLTAAIAGAALALSSLLVPAIASTSVASERESGTLRLLLTTGLTPADIVIGKLLAVLHGVAAPLLLALPLLASGALFGAVSALDVLFCAALLVVNVMALASVGVAASATSERVRAAPAKGVGLAALFVYGPIGIPSMVLVVLWTSEGYRHEMLVGGALLLGWALVVVVGSLLIARDALSPSSTRGGVERRRLVTLSLLGAPLLAAVSLVGLRAPVDVENWSVVYLLGFGGLALVVVVADVALRGPDGRGAFCAAARAGGLSSAGALLSLPVAALCLRGVTHMDHPFADVVTLPFLLACALPVVSWLLAAGALTALFARRVSSPARRVAATAAVLAALWFVPALLSSGTFGLVPLIDPVSLVHETFTAAFSPFNGHGAASFAFGIGGSLVVWLLLSLTLFAGGLRERVRERVLTRR